MVSSNNILIDWLTFTSIDMSLDDVLLLLGLQDVDFEHGLHSKLHYSERLSFGSLSIHFTPSGFNSLHCSHYNEGICVEMSGQGCREYETYGRGDFLNLFWGLVIRNCNITRLDLAYDDFTGVLPLELIARQALDLHFTSRLRRRSVMYLCPDQNLDHEGLSVCHGSRISEFFVRFYDKRVERARFDIPHWVRAELQLRGSVASEVVSMLSSGASIGLLYSQLLYNYLIYRDQNDTDSNKRRWPVSSWYLDFIGVVSPIHCHTKHGVEYNLSKLHDYIFGQAGNALRTAIAISGRAEFLAELEKSRKILPPKYKDLIRQNEAVALSNGDKLLEVIKEYEQTRD